MTHDSGSISVGVLSSISPNILIAGVLGAIILIFLAWKFIGSDDKKYSHGSSGIKSKIKSYLIYILIIAAILAAVHFLSVF